MLITLNFCLYLSFTFMPPAFNSDSCQSQGHFKLNGMYQDGNFIIGGLFEIQHLKVFPELSFRMKPEQPKCEEWVWKANDEKLYRLKIVKDQNEREEKTDDNNRKNLIILYFFIWLHAICITYQNQLLNRMCIVLK